MRFFSRSTAAPGAGNGLEARLPVRPAAPYVLPPKKTQRRRGPRWGALLISFSLIAGVAYYWKANGATKLSKNGEGIGVPTVVLSLGEVRATVRVTGTIAALNSASLQAPRVRGSRSGMNRGGDAGFGGGPGGPGGGDFNLVLLSLAKPGTPVKTGDVVAQFDPQNQLQRLDDYKDTVVQLDNNITGMMANLAALKEAHDQSVRTAKANWDKALLDLQEAPVLSAIDVEKNKLAVEEAEATYKQLVFESSLVEESQRAQIRISDLNRGQAKIELQRAETNVQRMTIKAPIDGMAVMASIVRNGEFGQIREGDQVFAGQPFLSIVDPSSMVLNATVNQVDAEKLRLGMKAIVHVDAYPDVALPATLTGIGALAKLSAFRASYVGEIPVRIKIDRIDSHLIPDLTGDAEIVLSSESNIVVAPRQAVFQDNGGSFVYLKSAEGWVRKQVQFGTENNTNVAIRSGLQKGDVIALQPPL